MLVQITHPPATKECLEAINNGAGVVQWRYQATGFIRDEHYPNDAAALAGIRQLYPKSRFDTVVLNESPSITVPMDQRQPNPVTPESDDTNDDGVNTADANAAAEQSDIADARANEKL